jgi:hypothetical protein
MDRVIVELEDMRAEVAVTSVAVISVGLDKRNAHRPARVARFAEGDYVMWKRHNDGDGKLTQQWSGPHQVRECLSEHRFTIEEVVTRKMFSPVHASHLQFYDDAGFAPSTAVRDQAAHDKFGFRVKRLLDHQQNTNRNWSLRIEWKGFEDAAAQQGERLSLGDALASLGSMT